jgi:hypothetical protein
VTRRISRLGFALLVSGVALVAGVSVAAAAKPGTKASAKHGTKPSAKKKAASTPFLLGIEDNAQILGNGQAVMQDLQALSPQVFRFTIFWSQIATEKPDQARNSEDPAYDWSTVDAVVKEMQGIGVPVLLTITSTPSWAGGGGGGLKAPKRMLDLQDFAYAAADRYSGEHVDQAGETLPKVVRWEAWNEPNLATHLTPQWTAIGKKKKVGDPFCFGKTWVPASPRIYRGILNAIYRGVHAAGTSNHVTESVAGGATAPYGKGPCASTPGFSPISFLQDLVKRPVSLDVWSHHPYRNMKTNSKPYKGNNVDVAGMPRLYKALNKAFPGRKVLVWVTEFGSQTNPPDSYVGVTLAQQAIDLRNAYASLRRSGRVGMLVWFLVRDEDIDGRPFAGGFQSGLEYLNGKHKPAFVTFQRLASDSDAQQSP